MDKRVTKRSAPAAMALQLGTHTISVSTQIRRSIKENCEAVRSRYSRPNYYRDLSSPSVES